jgi:hypothetical protein
MTTQCEMAFFAKIRPRMTLPYNGDPYQGPPEDEIIIPQVLFHIKAPVITSEVDVSSPKIFHYLNS